MANKRVDELPAASSVATSDLLVTANPITGLMNKATVAQVSPRNVEVSLTDGATITWNYSLGNIAKVTLGGDRTLVITNPMAQSFGIIIVAQDGAGNRTLTFPTGSLFPTGWALSTAAGASDVLGFYYDGTNYWWSIDDGYLITTTTSTTTSTTSSTTTTTTTSAVDPDAQNFITAASVVSSGDQTAINNFVVGLKSNSLWTKMRAFYPLYGTTISQAKFNLKDPSDTDVAGRLTEVGTFTYSGGATCTSLVSGDRLETHIASTDSFIGQDDVAIMVSCLTDIDELKIDFGSSTTAGSSFYIVPRRTDILWSAVNSTAEASTPANTNSIGRFYLSRTGSGSYIVYKDGSSLATISAASTTPDGLTFGIAGCLGVSNFTSTKKISTAGIFTGLSGAEITALDALISTFETALGR